MNRFRTLGTALTLFVIQAHALADEAMPQREPSGFTQEDLSMLALERETLANHLAAYVANTLVSGERPDRHKWAHRLLELALTLHPQNPRAKQAMEAVDRATPFPVLETVLEPEVLARLLYNRATGLAKNPGADALIAPYLIAAAAYIAPYFEDAVFAHENRNLRAGSLHWNGILVHAAPNRS